MNENLEQRVDPESRVWDGEQLWMLQGMGPVEGIWQKDP